jgi:hypothetical protein
MALMSRSAGFGNARLDSSRTPVVGNLDGAQAHDDLLEADSRLGRCSTPLKGVGSVRWIGIMVLAALSASGCAQQSNSGPPSAAAIAATSSAFATTSSGPFPRGQATALTQPVTVGPTIEILAPPRGEVSLAPRVNVSARVTDPQGVGSVTIQGVAATAAGGDVFSAWIDLTPGPNLIEIVALGTNGQRSTSSFQLVQGATRTVGAPIDGALAANLAPSGLAFAANQASLFARKVDLLPILQKKDPIWQGYGAKARVLSLDHKPIALDVQGYPLGALVDAKLDNLVVGLEVTELGIGVGAVSLEADRLNVSGIAVLDSSRPAAAKGSLPITVVGTQVSFDNFRLTASSSVVGTILGWAQGSIEQTVQDELKACIEQELAAHLGSVMVPGVASPIQVTLTIPDLGPVPLDMRVRPDAASGTPVNGLDLAAGVSLAPGTTKVTIPGGVYTSGAQARAGNTGCAATVAVSEDVANAFADALARSGLLSYTLDPKAVPASFPITCAMLQPFFKPVQELAPDKRTPIVIKAGVRAAPVFRFEPDKVLLDAGEVDLTVEIDYRDGQPNLELLTLSAAVELEATVSVVGGKVLRISDLKLTRFACDVIRTPAAKLPNEDIVKFADEIVPKLLDQLKPTLPDVPIPALPMGLVLKRADLTVHRGFVLVRGDL